MSEFVCGDGICLWGLCEHLGQVDSNAVTHPFHPRRCKQPASGSSELETSHHGGA